MKKRNIISLSGEPSSGKGAVSLILTEKLGYSVYRNGDYFRSLAKDMGMSLEEFGKYVSVHPEIDIAIENSAKEYATGHDNFIIDARLGFYAVPDSFKVYLTVSLDEAAKRAFNDEKRKDVENFSSVLEYKKALKARYELENERYFNVYGIRKDDLNNYNLVIDTTSKTPLEVSEIIIDEYYKWLDE